MEGGEGGRKTCPSCQVGLPAWLPPSLPTLFKKCNQRLPLSLPTCSRQVQGIHLNAPTVMGGEGIVAPPEVGHFSNAKGRGEGSCLTLKSKCLFI